MPSGPTLLLYLQKHYDLLTGDGVAEENPNPERVWNVFFFFFSDSFQFKY